METNIAYNLNKVIKELSETNKPTAIANGMGYTTTRQLYNSLEGKALLSTKAIAMLVKNFDVSPTFLFTGTQPMFLNQKPVQRFNYDVVSSTY